MAPSHQYALVGGGLQNGLIALAILAKDPGARLVLIERCQRLGGNHTWCFHADDISDDMANVVAPLIGARWQGYDVVFPTSHRSLAAPYAAVTSEQFHREVAGALAKAANARLVLGRSAVDVGSHKVVLDDGDVIEAHVVIDSRGPGRDPAVGNGSDDANDRGYQKFFGIEIETEQPHGIPRPVVMDATVAQLDGYRFMYLLPFDDRRLLVEDTYFSNSPAFDLPIQRQRVMDYIRDRSFGERRVVRQEHGILPMPWAGTDIALTADGPLIGGYAGGWFHPGTGYSFPTAARLAETVASTAPEALFDGALAPLARDANRQMRFARRLNKMLFCWFKPEDRYRIFERFYRLPEPTIRRFYALRTTGLDRARILFGRPPRGLNLRAVFGSPEAV